MFPSEQLLDHIPSLVDEIAGYLAAPAEEEIAANAAVMDKARELGLLRHAAARLGPPAAARVRDPRRDPRERFWSRKPTRLGLQPSVAECFEVQRRLTRAVRVLMRTTVDTFIGEYTATIQEQTERIKAFNRAASHELRSPIGTLLFAGALLEQRRGARRIRSGWRRWRRRCKSSAERLAWLVENLQRIARMSEPVDVPERAAGRSDARWPRKSRGSSRRWPARARVAHPRRAGPADAASPIRRGSSWCC